ncbi:MAG: hypothetical protein ACTSW1_15195 [Candidatus Hodarchaeales archaeon]
MTENYIPETRYLLYFVIVFLLLYPLIDFYRLSSLKERQATILIQEYQEKVVEGLTKRFGRFIAVTLTYTLFYILPILALSFFIGWETALLFWALTLPFINLSILAGTGVYRDIRWFHTFNLKKPWNLLLLGTPEIETWNLETVKEFQNTKLSKLLTLFGTLTALLGMVFFPANYSGTPEEISLLISVAIISLGFGIIFLSQIWGSIRFIALAVGTIISIFGLTEVPLEFLEGDVGFGLLASITLIMCGLILIIFSRLGPMNVNIGATFALLVGLFTIFSLTTDSITFLLDFLSMNFTFEEAIPFVVIAETLLFVGRGTYTEFKEEIWPKMKPIKSSIDLLYPMYILMALILTILVEIFTATPSTFTYLLGTNSCSQIPVLMFLLASGNLILIVVSIYMFIFGFRQPYEIKSFIDSVKYNVSPRVGVNIAEEFIVKYITHTDYTLSKTAKETFNELVSKDFRYVPDYLGLLLQVKETRIGFDQTDFERGLSTAVFEAFQGYVDQYTLKDGSIDPSIKESKQINRFFRTILEIRERNNYFLLIALADSIALLVVVDDSKRGLIKEWLQEDLLKIGNSVIPKDEKSWKDYPQGFFEARSTSIILLRLAEYPEFLEFLDKHEAAMQIKEYKIRVSAEFALKNFVKNYPGLAFQGTFLERLVKKIGDAGSNVRHDYADVLSNLSEEIDKLEIKEEEVEAAVNMIIKVLKSSDEKFIYHLMMFLQNIFIKAINGLILFEKNLYYLLDYMVNSNPFVIDHMSARIAKIINAYETREFDLEMKVFHKIEEWLNETLTCDVLSGEKLELAQLAAFSIIKRLDRTLIAHINRKLILKGLKSKSERIRKEASLVLERLGGKVEEGIEIPDVEFEEQVISEEYLELLEQIKTETDDRARGQLIKSILPFCKTQKQCLECIELFRSFFPDPEEKLDVMKNHPTYRESGLAVYFLATKLSVDKAIAIGIEMIQHPEYYVANPGKKLLNFLVFRDVTNEDTLEKFKEMEKQWYRGKELKVLEEQSLPTSDIANKIVETIGPILIDKESGELQALNKKTIGYILETLREVFPYCGSIPSLYKHLIEVDWANESKYGVIIQGNAYAVLGWFADFWPELHDKFFEIFSKGLESKSGNITEPSRAHIIRFFKRKALAGQEEEILDKLNLVYNKTSRTFNQTLVKVVRLVTKEREGVTEGLLRVLSWRLLSSYSTRYADTTKVLKEIFAHYNYAPSMMIDVITEEYENDDDYELSDYLNAITLTIINSPKEVYIQSSGLMRQVFEEIDSTDYKLIVLQSISKIINAHPTYTGEFFEFIVDHLREPDLKVRRFLVELIRVIGEVGWKEQAVQMLETLAGREEDEELLESIDQLLENF